MLSIPTALIFGIVGIIYDSRKVLAIITTIIASGFVLFYLWRIVMFSSLHADNVPVALLGLGLVIVSVAVLTYMVVKFSRQGGFGTMVIWLLLTGVSGVLGAIFVGVVEVLQKEFGTGDLGITGNVLLVYWGALAGILVQGLWSGIRGKGWKAKVGD